MPTDKWVVCSVCECVWIKLHTTQKSCEKKRNVIYYTFLLCRMRFQVNHILKLCENFNAFTDSKRRETVNFPWQNTFICAVGGWVLGGGCVRACFKYLYARRVHYMSCNYMYIYRSQLKGNNLYLCDFAHQHHRRHATYPRNDSLIYFSV